MTTEEKKEGFRVIDRRVVNESSAEAPPAGSSAPEASKPEAEVRGPGWRMREEKPPPPLPPMNFPTFCLSLASSAMIHLGLTPHPESGKPEASLPLAKQTIDILAMLEEKTRGNLTPDEARLLGSLLYDLRLRFVELSKAPPPPADAAKP